MREYGIKLENAGNELYIKLADKFSKGSKTFDARAMLDLMVAQIYVRNLKHHAPVMCYNSIVNSLSSCWDVSSVATHAQSYLERVVKEDELSTPNAFFGGKSKPNTTQQYKKPSSNPTKSEGKEEKRGTKRGLCYKFRDTGVCKWRKCKYEHPGRVDQVQPKSDTTNGQFVLKPVPGFQNRSLPGASE